MRQILVLALAAFVASTQGQQPQHCPPHCRCFTTPENLNRADCSDIYELQKYIRSSKNHSIDILNLSHNGISKINGQLDRLIELKTLDLSNNDITHVAKLLRHSKKLTHLNLSNNKLQDFQASAIPRGITSLYLANNLLKNVPGDLAFLENIEHLVLSGNPIECNCENLELRDSLHQRNAVLSDVICSKPLSLAGESWLQIKTSEYCKKQDGNMLDMMMGDQPLEVEIIGPETAEEKLMPRVDAPDLETGEVFEVSKNIDDDDERTFLTVPFEKPETTSNLSEIVMKGKTDTTTEKPEFNAVEGSGNGIEDDTFVEDKASEDIIVKAFTAKENAELAEDEVISAKIEPKESQEILEGSGDFGSGFSENRNGPSDVTVDPFDIEDEINDNFDGSGDWDDSTSTTSTESFITGMFNPFFISGNFTIEETFKPPESPKVYQGTIDWDNNDIDKVNDKKAVVEENIVKINKPSSEAGLDTDVEAPTNGRILLNENLKSLEEPKQPKKTSIGTYVCLAILAVLLVGLIMFAFVKGQIRKRRDRRLMRQQRKDVERPGKEMVDMNKSLLGKPAVIPIEEDKKINGKYELVPTHEMPLNRNSNGHLENVQKVQHLPTSAKSPPIDEREKSSHPDAARPRTNGNMDKLTTASSDEIFVPHNEDLNKSNGAPAQTLVTNGGGLNGDYLSPGREYVPVYSPDMGRVRIKITETPKPTTPVLITRTRSNAGDIIITPNIDQRPITTTTS